MESYHTKDLTLAIFQQILMEDEFRDIADVGIVIQAYLQGLPRPICANCATGRGGAARRSGCGWSKGPTGITRRCIAEAHRLAGAGVPAEVGDRRQLRAADAVR